MDQTDGRCNDLLHWICLHGAAGLNALLLHGQMLLELTAVAKSWPTRVTPAYKAAESPACAVQGLDSQPVRDAIAATSIAVTNKLAHGGVQLLMCVV